MQTPEHLLQTPFWSRLAHASTASLLFSLFGCDAQKKPSPPLPKPKSSVPSTSHTTSLTKDGKALLSIVIAKDASEATQKNAATLAGYLKKISGATFEVKTGDGKSGLVVGTAQDFPDINLAADFDAKDPMRREEYLLRSHANGVFLIGATDIAVQDAVWDFLYRLGYRQFFPGPDWEIIPDNPNLEIAVNAKEKPDYLSRRIWFSYHTWPENTARMADWNVKNRAISGVRLRTGHAYDGIISRHKAEFEAHPEYISPVEGEPPLPLKIRAAQLNISNPALRELVVNDALDAFEKDPALDSWSVDPNDGSHWGYSEAELKLGSVSDRVTLLANQVAEAVNAKFPGKFIGFYAYNKHSPPPSLPVSDHVVVSVATAFTSGGLTVDQIMEGWGKQGAMLGVREYYSIIQWAKDLPRGPRAARVDYIVETIPHFYENGARFMSAESGDNWGPAGLGYYLAARLLWDVDEAQNVPALIDDFLEKSFGPAAEPMRKFYGLINGIDDAPSRPLGDDFVGRMYRLLDAAYKKTDDPKIEKRLGDLALYTRYVELYLDAIALKDDEKQQEAYDNLKRFAWRIRDTDMVHSMAVYRAGLRAKKFRAKVPPEARWNVPAKDKAGNPLNPWKQSVPFTAEEIRAMVTAGIQNNALLDFESKTFSSDLVAPESLDLAPVTHRGFPLLRGTQDFRVFVPQAGPLTLQVSAGFSYSTRGPAEITLFPANAPGEDAAEGTEEEENAAPVAPIPLQKIEVPPDQQEHEVTLNIPSAGHYRIRVKDSMMATRVQFPEGLRVAVHSAVNETTALKNRWKLYFYVPKNTKFVGGFAKGGGKIHDADGNVVFTYPQKDGFFKIPVEPGQDGRLWMFEAIKGQIGLMTVPPWLFRSDTEALLPKEVVAADAQ